MNESLDTKRPQPKLYTKGKLWFMVCAVILGASWGIYREYHAKGSVSGVTIGSSIAAGVLGLILVLVVARYANKPER